MRLHYLVLVVAGVAVVTVTNGHPFERDEQTSMEESFADGEETEVDTGKKKSSLDSGLGKEDKDDNKEVINNDSRIEKLIDDISDAKSADSTERDFQAKIEDFAAHGSGCRSDSGCAKGVVTMDNSTLYSVLEDKKDAVNTVADEEEQSAEKKTSIAKTEDEQTETVKQKPIKFERKEDIDEPDEGSDKKEAEVTDYDEEATAEDVAKKDDVKPATTKEQSTKVEKVEVKAPVVNSGTPAKKREEHHHRHQLEKKTTAHKKDNAKKWWMVEGPHKWGGLGHSHWGPPHHTETDNEHHDDHDKGPEIDDGEQGESKSHVPACCKSKDHNARKRCDCPVEEEDHKEGDHPHVKEHETGYHFHDKGGTHSHNDKDHDLRGPWSFGYDGFGDDWGDWDHNRGDFSHLKRLEDESHGDHHEEHDGDHEGHDDHGDCSKRNCIADVVEDQDADAAVQPPLVAPVMATVPSAMSVASPLASGPSPYGGPVALVALPPPVEHGHALPYRVCHACHLLRDGGSRCLCKAIRHHHAQPVHHANTHFNHHVYIDCDAAVHNFPHKEHMCFPRHSVPKPEHVKQAPGGKS